MDNNIYGHFSVTRMAKIYYDLVRLSYPKANGTVTYLVLYIQQRRTEWWSTVDCTSLFLDAGNNEIHAVKVMAYENNIQLTL